MTLFTWLRPKIKWCGEIIVRWWGYFLSFHFFSFRERLRKSMQRDKDVWNLLVLYKLNFTSVHYLKLHTRPFLFSALLNTLTLHLSFLFLHFLTLHSCLHPHLPLPPSHHLLHLITPSPSHISRVTPHLLSSLGVPLPRLSVISSHLILSHLFASSYTYYHLSFTDGLCHDISSYIDVLSTSSPLQVSTTPSRSLR